MDSADVSGWAVQLTPETKVGAEVPEGREVTLPKYNYHPGASASPWSPPPLDPEEKETGHIPVPARP